MDINKLLGPYRFLDACWLYDKDPILVRAKWALDDLKVKLQKILV